MPAITNTFFSPSPINKKTLQRSRYKVLIQSTFFDSIILQATITAVTKEEYSKNNGNYNNYTDKLIHRKMSFRHIYWIHDSTSMAVMSTKILSFFCVICSVRSKFNISPHFIIFRLRRFASRRLRFQVLQEVRIMLSLKK